MKTEEAKAVGQRIRKLRGDKTQVEFAEDLGIRQSMICRYEAGTQLPRVPALFRIAQYEGVSIEWLLTGKADPAAQPMARDQIINLAAKALIKTGDPETKEFTEMMAYLFKNRRTMQRVLSYYRFMSR
ncbi:MAG TPA: helix-turn-helix transcriptional regulator [bacterium]|nr:helix-turn-helix transcriptional regulator [bacterium]